MISVTHLVSCRPRKFLNLILWSGNLMLLFYTISLSSRQVWVGLFIFFILAAIKRKRYSVLIVAILVIISQIDITGIFNNLDSSSAAHRFLNIISYFTDPESADVNSLSSNRTFIYVYSLDLIRDHPFFGLGFDSSSFKLAMNSNSSSHNYYITLFLKGGIFFGCYMMLLLGRIAWRTLGASAKRDGSSIWAPFVISALAQSLFWDVLLLPIASSAFFLIGGIAVNQFSRETKRLGL